MAEELRITVVDGGGGESPPTAPATPRDSSAMPSPPAAPPRGGGELPPPDDLRDRLGATAGAAARGDVLGALRVSAAGATGALGVAAAAATGVAVALGAVVVAARAYGRLVEEQVSNLQGLSADVAVAAAETQLGRQLGAIRRAERIGPELARAERTRSRVEGALDDLQTELLRFLLERVNALEPAIDGVVNVIEAGTEAVKHPLGQMALSFGVGGPLGLNLNALIELLRKREAERDPLAPTPWVEQFFRNVPGAPQQAAAELD